MDGIPDLRQLRLLVFRTLAKDAQLSLKCLPLARLFVILKLECLTTEGWSSEAEASWHPLPFFPPPSP